MRIVDKLGAQVPGGFYVEYFRIQATATHRNPRFLDFKLTSNYIYAKTLNDFGS